MADDPSNKGKQDDIRININQDHEVAYWSKALGVSEDELKKAHAKAGPLVVDIKKALGK